MISNCGKDENGKYTGGYAGDQTGKEWHIIPWYNRPWDCVLRYPDESVGKLISKIARASAKNDNIGYDQWQRLTFWEELKKVDYGARKITNKCEADCSAGVCSIVKAVGYRKGLKNLQQIPITTTHYMRDYFKTLGFEVLTDSKYLTSDDYLLPGDILLNINSHTATNLDYGKKVKNRKVIVKTKKAPCRNKPSTIGIKKAVFSQGRKLQLLEKNGNWYKVKGKQDGKNITGYIYAKRLEEI